MNGRERRRRLRLRRRCAEQKRKEGKVHLSSVTTLYFCFRACMGGWGSLDSSLDGTSLKNLVMSCLYSRVVLFTFALFFTSDDKTIRCGGEARGIRSAGFGGLF